MENLKKARQLVSRLKAERTRREAAWRGAQKWICPWRGCLDEGRDFTDDDSPALFTGAASQAALRGASGMTSGMTPRNTPWFKPDFNDPKMAELSGAREWLDRLDLLMKDTLTRGGFYQAIQCFNIDLLWAGCALLYSESARASALRFECVQAGSYWVALDEAGALDTVARLILMPVSAAARKFGEGALCRHSRSLLKANPFRRVHVWHLCRAARSGRWPVSSQWWEEGGESFLHEKGYYEMPYFFTCWNEGATAYGTGPGDQALPDARQLDQLERRKLSIIGKLSDPPVTAPMQLKDGLDLAPGGINFLPAHDMIRPILDLSPSAQAMRCVQEEIATVTKRLQDTLMASIFASIPMDQRPRGMTATEFLERKRESLQQLGPVISAYEPNVLEKALNRTLMSLERAFELPEPPEGLADQPLAMKVEFISPMANALRQSGAEAARSVLADISAIFESSKREEIWDKLDFDQTIDELARSAGAPGGMIRSDEDVEKLRKIRQEARAREEQRQNMERTLKMGGDAAAINERMTRAAKAAKDAGADPEGMGGLMGGL